MITRPKFEHIFHTAPKKIGLVEIYYNPQSARYVKELENVIKTVAKSMRIDMNKPLSDGSITVFVYPSTKVFNAFFGGELEKRTGMLKKRTLESMCFVETEDGAIHMVFSNGNYKEVMKILVTKVFGEYIEEKREKKLNELVKEELEPEEIEEEIEDEEEPELEEETELEEEIDEEELEEITDVNKEIAEIQEKNNADIPEWLSLGWIMYKRNKLSKTKDVEAYSEFIKEKGVTSQGKISKSQSIVNSYNFADESACAIVEYIVSNYGMRRLVELFENPNIKETLGISKQQFQRECKQSIKKKYVADKIKHIEDKRTSQKGTKEKVIGESDK